MINIFEAWFCICVIALTTGNNLALMESYSDDVSDETMVDINKRGWNMLRLGRGLQMLRLGKRSADMDMQKLGNVRTTRSLSDSNGDKLSASDVQAVLASIFDAPRDQSRRQPPLPRYGRDSNSNSRDLLDVVSTDNNGAFPLDLFPMSNTRLFFRPAPRGGRYRRSLPDGRFTYGDFFLQDGADRTRTVALPRIAGYVDQVSNVEPKAVPRPRIGRDPKNGMDDTKSQSA